MATIEVQKAIASAFVREIGEGKVDARQLTDDFTAWSINSGTITRDVYLDKLRVVHEIFRSPLTIMIDTVTGEPGRVAIQARSRGELLNGTIYTNVYMFLIEFDDADRIRHVREYYDQRRVTEILNPARQEWLERQLATNRS